MYIRRYLIRTILVALIVTLWSAIAAAAQSAPKVEEHLLDLSSLVSSAEGAEIEQQLRAASHRAKMDIAILTIDDLAGQSATEFADEAYEELGYGQGPSHDGVMLLVSIKEREWAITTEGFGIRALDDEAQDYIIKQVRPLLSDGKFAAAFSTFATLCGDIGADARAGKEFSPPRAPFRYLADLVLALVAGLIIAAARIASMRADLNSVRPNDAAADYVRSGSMQLRGSSDVFLFSNITRTKIQKASKSSTHTSSSGRTHGGSSGRF